MRGRESPGYMSGLCRKPPKVICLNPKVATFTAFDWHCRSNDVLPVSPSAATIAETGSSSSGALVAMLRHLKLDSELWDPRLLIDLHLEILCAGRLRVEAVVLAPSVRERGSLCIRA